ncbi:MAG: DNA polymerase III subunit beta [Candidatus Methylacidiphilales bacterium]
MKIHILKEHFLEGLQRVQNVVSTRTTLPVLSNVLLRAQKDSLSLATTDLDTGIQATVEAKVDRVGAVTLPARRLFSIVRELGSPDIYIEVDKVSAIIRAGGATFRIMGLPEEDFPPLAKLAAAHEFSLEQKILKEMLKQTAYAMSTEESRYVLNGVLLSFRNDKLTVVATDGRRLALVEQEMEIPRPSEVDAILPSKAVNELLRLLGDEGTAQIAVSDNQIAFTSGTTYLVSKRVEGNYPNYRQVIPTESTERITLERELFLTTVRRISLLSSDKSNSVKLALSKASLEISSATPDVGDARETMSVNYKGKDFSIAFNPDYLMDPLKNLDSDEVHLDFTDELSPGVIRYANRPFLYVIMPMRTA